MIGKSSEIKTAHISTDYVRFQKHLDSWQSAFPNVDIIDIKFSVSYVPGDGERVHALIIYKEAKEEGLTPAFEALEDIKRQTFQTLMEIHKEAK
ncbi:hypothetical protein [Paenibacillus macerans]|uniref:hypothetical protein n=1 Tax=Paenibacillus macerans TaxID=44252 RepID=UPI0020414DF8|nr:hypothetical protein [Paenibacillus macerans]MCM3704048.1 hypothetical protein [Paenibacillus macerans]